MKAIPNFNGYYASKEGKIFSKRKQISLGGKRGFCSVFVEEMEPKGVPQHK